MSAQGDVDFEKAADIFADVFPDASLNEVYERALAAAEAASAMGFDHEASVLLKTAAQLRLRISH
jgi:hypothetical protein